MPRGSRMFEEDLWVKANFPERIRYEAVIIEDENVLSPQTLNAVSYVNILKTHISLTKFCNTAHCCQLHDTIRTLEHKVR